MNLRIVAGAAGIALVLSAGVASAARIGDGATPGYLQEQEELRNEPGYNLGTGAARIGDGSDPDYEATQRALRTMPGFRFGEGAAHIGN